MGRLFVITLEGRVYSCKYCHTQLALADDIISRVLEVGLSGSCIRCSVKLLIDSYLGSNATCSSFSTPFALDCHVLNFQCSHGKAYLFENVVNVTYGEREHRVLITGLHKISDIFCVGCGAIVGWKYVLAYDKMQKYKEGKFILERFKLLGPDGSTYDPTLDDGHHSDSDDDDDA